MSLIPPNPAALDSVSIRDAISRTISKALDNIVAAGKMTSREREDYIYDLNEDYPKSYDWDAGDFDGSNYEGGAMDEDDWAIINSVEERQIQDQIRFYSDRLEDLREIYGD